MVPSSLRAAKASVLEAMPAKAVPPAKPLLVAPDGAGAHWFGPLDPHTPPKNDVPTDHDDGAGPVQGDEGGRSAGDVDEPVARGRTARAVVHRAPRADDTRRAERGKGFGGRNNLLEACSFGYLPIGAALDGVAPQRISPDVVIAAQAAWFDQWPLQLPGITGFGCGGEGWSRRRPPCSAAVRQSMHRSA